MSEPIAPAPESPFSAETVPPIIPDKPDHTKSRERRWGRAKAAGDKRDDEKRERPRPSSSKSPKRAIPNRKGQFVEPLEQFYVAISLAIMPFDPVCAHAVAIAAPRCAETLDELAYRNDAVRRIIFALVNTSAIGAVIAAHLPILLAIAMHHVPAVQQMLGVRGMEFAQNVAENMQENGAPDNGEANPSAA